MIKGVKMNEFDPEKGRIFLEIIYILTAAKNYTGNFSDTFFGPNYCTSSKESKIIIHTSYIMTSIYIIVIKPLDMIQDNNFKIRRRKKFIIYADELFVKLVTW